MRGILYSIHFFKDVLSDRTIRILTDNSVALFCLRRMGSLHSPPLDRVTRDLILFCHLRNISFVPAHIQGNLNVLADQGSRQVPLPNEWMLDPDLFESICHRISPFPQVDLFATRATARLSRYISPCPDPEAYRRDALDLSFSWNHFQSIYAFPPPMIMPQLAGRFRTFRGSMILIAPFVLSAVWMPEILRRASRYERVPANKPLFQFVGRDLVYQSQGPHLQPLYIFYLYPIPGTYRQSNLPW